MSDTTREDRLTAIDGLRLHVDHDLPEPCLPSLMDEIDALLARAEAAERERDEARAENARLREALEVYAGGCDAGASGHCGYEGNQCCETARAALTGEGE